MLNFSDRKKVDLVAQTYKNLISNKFKEYYKVGSIPENSMTFNNSVRFFDLVTEAGVGVYELMEVVLVLYGSKWCNKIFKKPYLPFNVMVGEKVRNRILKEFPKEAKVGKRSEDHVDVVIKTLSKFAPNVAAILVSNGAVVGTDEYLKKKVLRRYKNAK